MRKLALVTGASGGIGRSVAEKLDTLGYDLVLTCYKNPDGLKGLPGRHFSGDIGDPAFVRELFGGLGRLELLVNNAGISHAGLLQDMTDDEWRRLFATNLDAVFYTCREAIPLMLGKGGRIINISSVWGRRGASMEVAYSASKGALEAFTRALAKELAPSRIAVNAVSPGAVDTDMNRNLTAQELESLKEEIPFGRFAVPEEIAEAVAMLASAPEYLTGEIIGINGGWY
ncbi:MAG: SDR family oxidoreductase [Lachnospiraceae bacterium]|nr:SDR family oxidoreductase [Lachnospiraceae bacterium]